MHARIADYTDRMVGDCALDTASIFLYDRFGERPRLSYLHHVGVSQEAQHRYRDGMVYRSDPFPLRHLGDDEGEAGPSFLCWGDSRIEKMADRAPAYRSFLYDHDVHVVGAFTRRMTARSCLVIGTHRKKSKSWHREVPMNLLRNRLYALGDMVIEELLRKCLEDNGYEPSSSCTTGATPSGEAHPELTEREWDIMGLVQEGMQNKQIAFRLGLSEYSIENRLRRIYRKCGVRNRTAAASLMTELRR